MTTLHRLSSVLTSILCPVLLYLAAAPAAVAAPVQGVVVEGTVTRPDTSEPVDGATVTLSTGLADPIVTRALQLAAENIGISVNLLPPASVQPTPPGTAPVPSPGSTAPIAAGSTMSDEQIFRILTEAALSRGMSPASADLATALHNFRDQTAKFTAYTSSDGRFSISGVPPGQYTLRAERDGYFATRGAVAAISVPGAAAVALSMLPGATIGGRIRDDDGEFVANATVQAFTITYQNGFPTLSPSVTTKTDFRGNYRLFWMPAGDYIIGATRDGSTTVGARTFYPGTPEVTSAESMSLKTGENREAVDFGMADGRLIKVSGEVISLAPSPSAPIQPFPDGLTLPNEAQLFLVPRDPSAPDGLGDPTVATVPLNPNHGSFEFAAPPGAYTLFATVLGTASGRIALDLIGNQDVRGVTVTVQPPLPFKGTVSANDTAVDPTKVRLSFRSIDRDGALGSLLGTIIGGNAVIRPDRTFAATVPMEGRYRVAATGLPPGFYLSAVRQNGKDVYNTGAEASMDSPPIEVVLSSGAGILAGVVRDAQARTIPNAMVSLVPAAESRENRALYRVSATAADGRFTIPQIVPGDYTVFAWQSIPSGSYFSAKFLARYEEKGRPVTVAPGSKDEVVVTLANEP